MSLSRGEQSGNVSGFEGVTSIDQITPIAQKPGGTRNGYVGYRNGYVGYTENRELYLVKIEQGGYNTTTFGGPTEAAGIESFTAQLIRDIWGPEYATDIRVARFSNDNSEVIALPVDNNRNEQCAALNLHPIEEETFTADTTHPYAIVVPYENQGMEFEAWLNLNPSAPIDQTRLTEIQTIAKIVRVDDYKFGNMLIDFYLQVKLIDCGARFHCVDGVPHIPVTLMNELYHPQFDKEVLGYVPQKEVVEPIVLKFISYTNEQLTNLLNHYENILSDETRELLFDVVCSLKTALTVQLQAMMNPPSITSTALMMAGLNISSRPEVTSSQQTPQDVVIAEASNTNAPHQANKIERVVNSDETPSLRKR